MATKGKEWRSLVRHHLLAAEMMTGAPQPKTMVIVSDASLVLKGVNPEIAHFR
jgi:hypothetical protein